MSDLFDGDVHEVLGLLTSAIGSIDGLTEEMRRARQAQEATAARTRWMAAAGALLVVAMIVLAAQGLAVRSVTNAIRDCTEPGGHCYETNAARSGQAVKAITDQMERTRLAVCASAEPSRRPADCPPPTPAR